MGSSGTSKWREWFQSLEVLAATGLVFAALFIASLQLLGDEPPMAAGAGEIESWFADSDRLAKTLTGVNLAPVSIIALLWFMAVFRRRLGTAEDKLFSTVFVGSGVVFSALYLCGVAAVGAGALMVEYTGVAPAVPTWQLLRALGKALLAVHAAKLAAVFTISMATVGLRSGAFMKVTAILGYALGAAMLVGAMLRETVPYLLPAWIAIASLDLLVRRKLLLERLRGTPRGP
ncbi:MAG TPA: hypothetical protein DFS52_14595 [Myxococcales bacterium]|nr:hypothetical protein [Myxococcales bacterium]